MQVKVRLNKSALKGEAGGCQVRVTNEDLPLKLRIAIAQELHDSWAVSTHSGGASASAAAGVQGVFETLQQSFVRLLGLVPACLEAYEGVDASGASVRRYAIIDPDSSACVVSVPGTSAVELGTSNLIPSERDCICGATAAPSSSQPHVAQEVGRHTDCSAHSRTAATLAATSAAATPRPGIEPPTFSTIKAGVLSPAAVQQQLDVSGATASAQLDPPSLSFPEAISKELQFLSRRFPSSFKVLHTNQGPAAINQSAAGAANRTAGSSSGTATDAGNHPSAVPGQRVPGTSSRPEGDGSGSEVLEVSFRVDVPPTDPGWDRSLGPVMLEGTLSSQYPSPGSVLLQVAFHCPLPRPVCRALEAAAAEQLQRAAGRPTALRNAIKYLENYAGSIVQGLEEPCGASRSTERRFECSSVTQMGSPAPSGAVSRNLSNPAGPEATGSAGKAVNQFGNISEAANSWDFFDAYANSGGDGSNSSSGSCYSDDGYNDGSSSEEEGDESLDGASPTADAEDCRANAIPGDSISLQNNAYCITLEGLRLDNIGALQAVKLGIQVVCSRCGQSETLEVASDAVAGSAGNSATLAHQSGSASPHSAQRVCFTSLFISRIFLFI